MKSGRTIEERFSRAVGKILEILSRQSLVSRSQKKAKAAVFLLSDNEMKKLKNRFLPSRKHLPPNVLSFSEPKNWPHPESKRELLGEIYLNRDLIQGDQGESTRLLVHGLLHLLGYDHEKSGDARKMENVEKDLSKRLVIR